ncbi:hypothetical protein Hanom_Chr13g01192881 [Helianthus anomalus]
MLQINSKLIVQSILSCYHMINTESNLRNSVNTWIASYFARYWTRLLQKLHQRPKYIQSVKSLWRLHAYNGVYDFTYQQ